MNFGPNIDHLSHTRIYTGPNSDHLRVKPRSTRVKAGQTADITLWSIHYLDRIYSEREPLMLYLVTLLVKSFL